MKRLISVFSLVTAFAFLLMSPLSFSQQLKTPRESPAAEISQVVGMSKITVNYSRPAVKGRKVWGELVPFGLAPNAYGNEKPMPWRAGANENTFVTFSHDVLINGSKLEAGSYGIHMIPDEKGEWTIIFSKDFEAWGSFFYEDKNDALRIKVKPEESQFTEWLEYGFDKLKNNSARVYLRWEKLLIGFNAEFDTDNITLESIRTQLTGAGGFSWQNWNQAAVYCLQAQKWLDLGEKWIAKSISLNENSTNRNILGYIVMAQNRMEDALKIFKENTEKFPTDWNVYDSYGEALANAGKKKEAADYFKKALEKAPKGQRSRIEKTISDLSK